VLAVIMQAACRELLKMAASNPGIIAAPTPGGDGGFASAEPPKPVTSQNLVSKVVTRTNLQKTNYTKPNSKVVTPNPAMTTEQKSITPPAVTA